MKFGLDLQPNFLKKDKMKEVGLDDWYFDDNGNKIHKTVLIGKNVTIGKNNIFFPYSVIGLPGFVRDSQNADGNVIIGDNNKFGLFISIMVGVSGTTEIGSDNFIMNYVNVGHDVKIGNQNEIGVKSLLAGYSRIGNGNKIKISSNIRNRVTIGNGNIIGMSSNVTKNFEDDGWVIYGNPAVKIKKI